MSEKAVSIGHYFVASGVYTVFGVTWPTSGSPELTKHLFEEMEKTYGGRWDFAADPKEMAKKMIAHIDRKRKDLGIDKARERILFDMADRRELA
jgi:carbon-monoxide dehydrogenase catalytic subunit